MIENKRISPLELYVKASLKQKTRREIRLNFIRKALTLVEDKLGIPCCDDPTATVNLYTRFDNDFTNTVRAMLINMPKQGNVQSLQRVRRILTNFITPLCCV